MIVCNIPIWYFSLNPRRLDLLRDSDKALKTAITVSVSLTIFADGKSGPQNLWKTNVKVIQHVLFRLTHCTNGVSCYMPCYNGTRLYNLHQRNCENQYQIALKLRLCLPTIKCTNHLKKRLRFRRAGFHRSLSVVCIRILEVEYRNTVFQAVSTRDTLSLSLCRLNIFFTYHVDKVGQYHIQNKNTTENHQIFASLALCEGNPLRWFPSQRASNVGIIPCHDVIACISSSTHLGPTRPCILRRSYLISIQWRQAVPNSASWNSPSNQSRIRRPGGACNI